MTGFVHHVEELAERNASFYRVLFTGRDLHFAVMCIGPDDETVAEAGPDRDEFFGVQEGSGEVWIEGQTTRIESGYAVLVPAGVRHVIRNTGSEPLKLFALYGPAADGGGAARKREQS